VVDQPDQGDGLRDPNYGEALDDRAVTFVDDDLEPTFARHMAAAGKAPTAFWDDQEPPQRLHILRKLHPDRKFDAQMAAILSWEARLAALKQPAPNPRSVAARRSGASANPRRETAWRSTPRLPKAGVQDLSPEAARAAHRPSAVGSVEPSRRTKNECGPVSTCCDDYFRGDPPLRKDIHEGGSRTSGSSCGWAG
jgi:hypothetical protein